MIKQIRLAPLASLPYSEMNYINQLIFSTVPYCEMSDTNKVIFTTIVWN